MIKVTVYQNQDDVIYGFYMEGHAGFAEFGSDIVCSAVSALVINTMNSIDKFTDDKFDESVHKKDDVVSFFIVSKPVSTSAELLLKSLVLGLGAIQSEYGKKYIRIKIKRKQEV